MKWPFSAKSISVRDAMGIWPLSTVRRMETLHRRYNPNDVLARAALDRALGVVHQCAATNASVCSKMPLRLMRRVDATDSADRRAFAGKVVHKTMQADMSTGVMGRKIASFADSGGEVEEVVDHPLLDLLANPNPDFPGSQMAWLNFYFKEITGKSYELMALGEDGTPAMLFPLLAQYTEVLFDDATGELDGFRYARSETHIADFEPEDVIFYKHNISRFNPNDGEGPLVGVLAEADLLMKNLIHDIAFVDGGNRPDSVWAIKDPLTTDDQVNKLERRIKDKFGGASQMAKPFVTRGDVAIQPLAWSEKELQSLAKIEFFEKRIRQAFGHTESMADSNASTYASALVGYDHQYMGATIHPRLLNDAAQKNATLLPMFGLDPDVYCLVYDNPVVKDEGIVADRTRADVAAGVLTINEARSERGLEPVDDEGADLVRVNGAKLETLDSADGFGLFGGGGFGGGLPPTAPTPTGDDDNDEVVEVAPQKIEESALNGAQIAQLVDLGSKVSLGELSTGAARGIALASFPSIPVDKIDAIFDSLVEGGAALSDEEKSKGAVRSFIRKSINDNEGRWWLPCDCEGCTKAADGDDLANDPIIDDIFEDALEPVESSMEDIIGDMQDEVIQAAKEARETNLDQLKADAAEILRDQMEEVVAESVRATLSAAGQDVESMFDVAQTSAMEFLDTHVIRVADDIADTTESMIRPAIQRGLDEGLSIDNIAELIEGEDIPAYRAERIARTEVQNAAQGGRYETLKEVGVELVQWVNAPGATDAHQIIANRIYYKGGEPGVQKMGKPFVTSNLPAGNETYTRDVYHPPARPNCRCSIRAIFDDLDEDTE